MHSLDFSARTLPSSKGLYSLAAKSQSYNGMLCHFGFGPKHTYGGNRIILRLQGLPCYTLGSGFGLFARSLLSSLVEKDMVGTLYTTLSIMDTLGSLLAGPVVAGIFGWSMRLDGVWKGMPYLVSFVLCGLASVALSCLGFLDSLRTEHVPAAYDEETAPFLASDIPPSESHD
ncbi:hypothetical protein MCOR23_003579 [Pyricularia oryzae]|uniref:Major facilitator superfamily (MFS) profile domain-containing protein n=1 Tax=Pyricularia oryzae TaxID=318829 RepID=A0A4P7N9H9_PYROR|nr:hypothetical protein MCOR23_003579 [Pyricularia oryzae]QBZ59368.1 hypothetical protein PoMZ_04329 [Pyricularia oryzae]